MVALPALASPLHIGPGHEAAILALLQPFANDHPVTPSVRLSQVAIAHTAVTLVVTEPSGQAARLTLTPQDHTPPAPSFVIAAAPAASPQLQQAVDALSAAIRQNDHGQVQFVAPAPSLPLPPPPPQRFEWPAAMRGHVLAALALWLVWLGALLLGRPRVAVPRRERWAALVIALLLGALAWHTRLALPFWPIHANGHWTHDAALALRIPAMATRDEMAYGPAWVLAQQAALLPFSQDMVGLGQAAALLGALASMFAFLAAWALARSLPWAVLGALVVALAPAATRVGFSESPFVVAQLLLATALYAGARLTGLAQALLLLASAALLALGHPFGLGYGLAALLLGWSLSVRAAPADRRSWWHLGLLVAILLVLAATALALQHDMLRDHLTGGLLSLPLRIRTHSVWRAAAWAPVAVWPLALWGLGTLVVQLRWRAVPLLLGLYTLAWVGTLHIACLTDSLRYQAPWAVGLAVAVGAVGVPASAPSGGRRRGLVLGLGALGLVVGAQLLQPGPGARALDAQGQFWQVAQRVLTGPADVELIVANPPAGSRASLGLPAGKWSPVGPRVLLVHEDVASARCARGGALPESARVVYEPACADSATQGCRSLDALAGAVVASGVVAPLPPAADAGIAAEYLDLPPRAVPWRITRARCPPVPAAAGP